MSPFSLVSGGALYRIAGALRLLDRSGRLSWWVPASLAAVAWVPLCALATWTWRTTGKFPALFVDYSLHARLLVAIPAFFVAERSLQIRTARCLERIVNGAWTAGGEAGIARATAEATRARDSIKAEVAILILAIAGSQALLRGVGESLGMGRARLEDVGSNALLWWDALVSLPIYQFVAFRGLWRWAIWARLLWRLSRLPLRPEPTHPDRQGGLGFLSEPAIGFAPYLFGLAAVQSGVWANMVVFKGMHVLAFKGPLLVALVIGAVLAMGPLVVFAPTLQQARFAAIREHDRLGLELSRLFRGRWMERTDREPLLGTQDVSTVCDYASVYDVVRGMRLVPFGGARPLIVVAAVIFVPMLPLITLEIPLVQLIQNLASAAAGVGP